MLYLFPVVRLIVSLMRPITVVSSANMMMELDPYLGLQSWVKRE